jgi:hypothetical protein
MVNSVPSYQVPEMTYQDSQSSDEEGLHGNFHLRSSAKKRTLRQFKMDNAKFRGNSFQQGSSYYARTNVTSEENFSRSR